MDNQPETGYRGRKLLRCTATLRWGEENETNHTRQTFLNHRHRYATARSPRVASTLVFARRDSLSTTHRSVPQSSTPIHTSYRPLVRRCSLSEVRAKSPLIPFGCAWRFPRASSSCQTSLLFRSVTKSNFEKRDSCFVHVVVCRCVRHPSRRVKSSIYTRSTSFPSLRSIERSSSSSSSSTNRQTTNKTRACVVQKNAASLRDRLSKNSSTLKSRVCARVQRNHHCGHI